MIASLPHKPQTKRGIAFERLFRIAEDLRGLRYGRTLQQLAGDISDATGHDWHVRTIRRDIELLEYLGLVTVDDDGRIRWTGPELMAMPADRVGRAKDAMSHLHQTHYHRQQALQPIGGDQ